MPQDFDMCMKNGGKVRTKTMGIGKYAHVCIDKMGKTHVGEIKKYKKVLKGKK